MKQYKIIKNGIVKKVFTNSVSDAIKKFKDSIIEDSSFDALFQFVNELREISFKSDERVIRSVFLKAETIAKQVESSIRGLSAEYKTKLANFKKDPDNKTVEREYYKVVKVVSSIKSALVDCMQFFETSEGEITRALSIWKNGRIVGQRFEGKTDKYLSMAKKYYDRFLRVYQQLNTTLQDSITEDSVKDSQVRNMRKKDKKDIESKLNSFGYKVLRWYNYDRGFDWTTIVAVIDPTTIKSYITFDDNIRKLNDKKYAYDVYTDRNEIVFDDVLFTDSINTHKKNKHVNDSVDLILDFLIAEEHKAIDDYRNAIDNPECTEEMKARFEEIISDEEEHVQELEELKQTT